MCKKPGHIALTCYHRFDHSFQGVSPNLATFVAGPPSQFDANWYPDSGSTNHDQIRVGDGIGLDIKHIGSSKLLTSSTSFPLKHVLHVPDIPKNLVSVSQFTRDHDVFIEFHANYFCVKDETTGRLLLRGRCEHGLYPFPTSLPSRQSFQAFLGVRVPLDVWHCRFGHLAHRTVQRIISRFSLPVVKNKTNDVCGACQ